MGKFQSSVVCKAPASEVYQFLSSGAKIKLTVKASDPNGLKVTLKRKMGLLSYGEIVECSIAATEMGCRVQLDGRPVLATNVTADVKGAVMMVQDAIVKEFGSR